MKDFFGLLKKVYYLEHDNLALRTEIADLQCDKLTLMDAVEQWEKVYKAAVQEMIVQDREAV